MSAGINGTQKATFRGYPGVVSRACLLACSRIGPPLGASLDRIAMRASIAVLGIYANPAIPALVEYKWCFFLNFFSEGPRPHEFAPPISTLQYIGSYVFRSTTELRYWLLRFLAQCVYFALVLVEGLHADLPL